MFDFSRISRESATGRILRLPLRLIPRNLTMRICQGPLRGKKWIAGSSNHGCWLGSYEFDKQLLIAQTLEKGKVFFDIGANVGFYTLLASSLVGDTGRVFAFEPVPKNVVFLKKHLEMNHLRNATVFSAAVSERSGVAQFSEGPNNYMGRLADEGTLAVELVSLDELSAKGNLDRPDYIKIDVEGAELSVLRGARVLLADACPTIFLATHGSEVHSECLSLLQSLGYICRPLDETRDIQTCDEVVASKPA